MCARVWKNEEGGKKEKKLEEFQLKRQRQKETRKKRESSFEDGRLVDSFAKVCAYRSCIP